MAEVNISRFLISILLFICFSGPFHSLLSMLSNSKLIVTNTFNIFQTCLVMSCLCAKFLHSCPTLCDPMDCSPSGSSVHGILQARILEMVAISFSRGSSLTQGSNLDWQLFSYIILFMFQCHSPKSSHPLPLPQSP